MEQNNLNNEIKENEEIIESEVISENEEMVEDESQQLLQDGEFEENADYVDDMYKKKKDPLVIAVAVMAVLILILGAALIWSMGNNKETSQNSEQQILTDNVKTMWDYYTVTKEKNEEKEKAYKANEAANTAKYNNLGYSNVSGKTLGDFYTMNMFEAQGVSFNQFLAMYGLPEDITKDTYFDVAQYITPIGGYFDDIEKIKTEFGVTEVVTDSGNKVEVNLDMPMGLILDEMTISNARKFMGAEEDLETFKTEYGLGEEVTEKTKWKEVRAKVEEVDTQKRIEEEAAKKAEEEAQAAAGEQEVVENQEVAEEQVAGDGSVDGEISEEEIPENEEKEEDGADNSKEKSE